MSCRENTSHDLEVLRRLLIVAYYAWQEAKTRRQIRDARINLDAIRAMIREESRPAPSPHPEPGARSPEPNRWQRSFESAIELPNSWRKSFESTPQSALRPQSADQPQSADRPQPEERLDRSRRSNRSTRLARP